MELTTRRLVLRGPQAGDIDGMFDNYSDPCAMRFWSTAPHADKSVTQRILDQHMAAWAKAQVYFQITLDGRYIGSAGNHHKDEVGFMLHPDYWRQGILTEAMRAIIPHLWEVTAHARLTADVDPENTASLGLLRNLGFLETHRAARTFFINGVWSDSVYLAFQRPS
ncbi:GNAT family N-acetyltransferase [Yoonia sp.]|uniref:GNAT family N-acetyltransferase n=1 Tax=Yoonia sp. TaxID=2212373 RepID=UPI003F6BDE8F